MKRLVSIGRLSWLTLCEELPNWSNYHPFISGLGLLAHLAKRARNGEFEENDNQLIFELFNELGVENLILYGLTDKAQNVAVAALNLLHSIIVLDQDSDYETTFQLTHFGVHVIILKHSYQRVQNGNILRF